jgi:hypothetical protein
LFRPFDLGRWFVIGFCAWLARLAEGGGGGGSRGGVPPGGPGSIPPNVSESVNHAREWLVNNLYWLIPVSAIGVIIVIGLIVFIVWLRSRGQFMFLYCVAQNKAEVKNPWHQFRRHGDSLFGFRVVLGIVAFLIMAIFIGVGIAAFLAAHARSQFTAGPIAAMALCGLLAMIAAILASVVAKFTKDFVVPIMYLRTPSTVQGWRILLDVLSFNKGRFFLYILFQIVIVIAVGAIVVAASCLTCCCAGCILNIPYVGTVLYLPVLVFLRSYSMYYLAQYGPELNAFAPAPQAVPPASPPLT